MKGKLKGKEKEILSFRGNLSAYKVAKRYGVSHTAIYKIWKKFDGKDMLFDQMRRLDTIESEFNFIYDQGYEQGFFDALKYVGEFAERQMLNRRRNDEYGSNCSK